MLDNYFIFVALAVTITALPGPAVLLTVKNSIRYGVKASLANILGNFVAMVLMATLSALGLGAIILASAELFTLIKIAGCGYLIYLGIKAWRAQPQQIDAAATTDGIPQSFTAIFKQGLFVGLSNPKAIAFFTAIFPQFIAPNRSYLLQFAVLILTIEGISTLVLASYALGAAKTVSYVESNRTLSLFHKLTGGTFIGFGLALLSEK